MSARPDREIAARAIYLKRPFRVTSTGAVMDPLDCNVREHSWEGAPAFYRDECYELADAVIAALTFEGLREQRPLPEAA
jgi:hypothetical protein